MIKTIHTLSIKDYALFEETGDLSYLFKVGLPRFLYPLFRIRIENLKKELLKRFNARANTSR